MRTLVPGRTPKPLAVPVGTRKAAVATAIPPPISFLLESVRADGKPFVTHRFDADRVVRGGEIRVETTRASLPGTLITAVVSVDGVAVWAGLLSQGVTTVPACGAVKKFQKLEINAVTHTQDGVVEPAVLEDVMVVIH